MSEPGSPTTSARRPEFCPDIWPNNPKVGTEVGAGAFIWGRKPFVADTLLKGLVGWELNEKLFEAGSCVVLKLVED